MRVRVLGCHGGESPRHRSTCFLLDGTAAIDAGSLTSRLTLPAQQKMRHVLISHSHLDHVKDLAGMADNIVGLINQPIDLWATPGTVAALREHYFNDILWPDFTRIPTSGNPVYRFNEIQFGNHAQVGPYQVKAVPVSHPVESSAFIIRRGHGKALAFSSDTGPSEAFWEAVNADGNVGAVLLEVSFPNQLQALADIAGHLTPQAVASELNKLRKPVPVYLYHMKPAHLAAITQETRRIKYPRLRLLKLDDRIVIK